MIDFHTHPLLVKEVHNKDKSQLKATREVFNICNNLQPLETFFLQMDVCGIEKSVLLPIDCSTARKCKISSNEIIAGLCRESNRFIGFASVDPHSKDAPDELEHAIKKLKLKGLKLAPEIQGFSPVDRKLAYPLYEKASALNIPLIIHAGMSWEPGTKINNNPLVLEAVAIDFPKLNIVIAHFGWPWVMETVAMCLKYPNVYTDTSCLYFDSPVEFINFVMTKQVPVTAVERSLRNKIIFGSNYPRVEIKNMVKAVQSLGLTDGCLELIFRGNAERLLQI